MIMITQKTRLSLYLVWSQTRQAILPSVSGCGSSFLHDPVLRDWESRWRIYTH